MKNMEKVKKRILIGLGFIAIILGVLGIILPILPTTPFILLAAYLFSKSSDRFHRWLVTHRILGQYIRNYAEKRGLPLHAKIIMILLLWLTILLSVIWIVQHLWIRVMLFIIAVAVSIHLIWIPIYRKDRLTEQK